MKPIHLRFAYGLLLTAGGPGVFFAAFGMWLLVQLVNNPLETESEEPIKALIKPQSTSDLRINNADKAVYSDRSRFGSTILNFLISEASAESSYENLELNNKETCAEACLLKKVKRKLFAGSQLTGSTLESAIAIAIAELKRAERGESPESDRSTSNARLKAIDILNQTKNRIVK